MKAADITIGEDYEVHEGGGSYRATVTAIGRKARTVYSSHEFSGHPSESIVVTISTAHSKRDVLPQAIKRLWADGEQGRAAKEARRQVGMDTASALTKAGLRCYWDSRSGQVMLGGLSVPEAQVLTARLAEATS